MTPLLPGLESIAAEVRQIEIEKSIREGIARIEKIARRVSTGPWKHDSAKNFGDNWLIASFGVDENNAKWLLTTDHVHASELSGDAEADAEFCSIARYLLPLLIEEWKR